jgi:hypothetical protein
MIPFFHSDIPFLIYKQLSHMSRRRKRNESKNENKNVNKDSVKMGSRKSLAFEVKLEVLNWCVGGEL